MSKVWVYIDQFEGQALGASWEVVGAARDIADQLGTDVTALVFGSQVDQIAQEAFQYGADEVLVADNDTLRTTVLSRMLAFFPPGQRKISPR
jgi:electron transfer flavoprotein alpha subunit